MRSASIRARVLSVLSMRFFGMARIVSSVFALVCIVYFYEHISGNSLGIADRIHNAGDWVEQSAAFQLFGS